MPDTGWDFENFLDNERLTIGKLDLVKLRGYASLDGWKGDGVPGVSPFLDLENVDVSWKAAPVYGNAIPIQRIRPPGWRDDIEWRIGGDYWRFSQDINQHGDFWIGSLDRRYSWRQHPGEDLAGTLGLQLEGSALETRFLGRSIVEGDHLGECVRFVRVRSHSTASMLVRGRGAGPGDRECRARGCCGA